MSKEELIGKLQMVYVGDKNALNELVGYYDGLKEIVQMVQQDNINLYQALNEIKDKLLCYGETFDGDVHQQFQRECLQIIYKVLGDDEK